jgi:hypothetical protein
VVVAVVRCSTAAVGAGANGGGDQPQSLGTCSTGGRTQARREGHLLVLPVYVCVCECVCICVCV